MAGPAGRVALITGAARGQGRAHALRLAADGAAIIAVDVCEQIESVPYPLASPEDLATTVRLVEATGARIVAERADVRDLDALRRAVAAGVDELGRLDIVVANAGIAPLAGGPQAWRDVIDVNLTGVHHTVEAALPHLLAHGDGGSVVLISSVAGLVGMGGADPGALGYTAAKHGIVGLMRQYANLLARHNIRVNSVHPTGVHTPMIDNDFTRAFLERVFADTERPADSGNLLDVDAIEPEDVAEAVAWLVSDAARYITGVALPVDAGSVLRR